jgi:hypothetical protein
MSKPLIAWRWWSRHVLVDETGQPQELYLKSVTFPTIWEGPVLRTDKLPRDQNHHGIHAVKFPYIFMDPHYIGVLWENFFGEVELYGKIVEHEIGYRAERA